MDCVLMGSVGTLGPGPEVVQDCPCFPGVAVVVRRPQEDRRSHIGLDPVHQMIRYHPVDTLGLVCGDRIRLRRVRRGSGLPDEQPQNRSGQQVSGIRLHCRNQAAAFRPRQFDAETLLEQAVIHNPLHPSSYGRTKGARQLPGIKGMSVNQGKHRGREPVVAVAGQGRGTVGFTHRRRTFQAGLVQGPIPR